ncbi:MAG: glycosyltransferase [Rhodobacterales bacterium]|nr:glycosyltransferase [Rhodobacterales bacterium]
MTPAPAATDLTLSPQPAAGVALDRVLIWGSYDLGKPRTRILRDGLKAIGVEVIEIHADIWSRHEDKSRLGRGAMLLALLRLVAAYPLLLWRYLRAPDHQIVLVPYMGQFDVLVLWLATRLRRKPLIWDMFISLYDTVAHDRALAAPRSLSARLLWLLEWLGCRSADLVLMDTAAHARHVAAMFGLKPGHVVAVPVGAEPEAFERLAPPDPHTGPTRILFYGQMIPLHGISTVLSAALSRRGRARHWALIGTGQDRPLVEAALTAADAAHVEWQDWLPYDRLSAEIGKADICLGIFGNSQKAASVVPNKVYQALLSGRSVITRLSPAMLETFGDTHPGLELVPPGDPEALLDAIERLERAGFPTLPEDRVALSRPAEIAGLLAQHVAPLVEGHDR